MWTAPPGLILESMIEPTLDLYGESYAKIERHLQDLLDATGVRFGLLVDRKGFVVCHREAKGAPKPPALDSVATLVASNAAATGALANMLGETTFSEQVHQGENGSLYVESVGADVLMALIFDSSVPLGKVKIFAKKAISQMLPVFQTLAEAPPMDLGADFHQDASSLLDDLLG